MKFLLAATMFTGVACSQQQARTDGLEAVLQRHQAAISHLGSYSFDFEIQRPASSPIPSMKGDFVLADHAARVRFTTSDRGKGEIILRDGRSYSHTMRDDGVASAIRVDATGGFGPYDPRLHICFACFDAEDGPPHPLINYLTWVKKHSVSAEVVEDASAQSVCVKTKRRTVTLWFDPSHDWLVKQIEGRTSDTHWIDEVVEFGRVGTDHVPRKVIRSLVVGGKKKLLSTAVVTNWKRYETPPAITWSPKPNSIVLDEVERKERRYDAKGKLVAEIDRSVASFHPGPPIEEPAATPAVTTSEPTNWWMLLAPLSLIVLGATAIYAVIKRIRSSEG